MRILDVVSSLNPEHGGPVEGIRQHAQIRHEYGFQVEVATLDDAHAPWIAGFPATVHALGPTASVPGLTTYGYAPRLLQWLRASAANYDAVIVHGLWQYQTLATWRALRGAAVPYYVFPHGMLDPWFNRTYPLKHAKKWLYWRAAEHRALRDARAVLFTCEEECLLARQSFSPYRVREAVVGYGVTALSGDMPSQREAFLQEFPGLREKRLFLFLSRLHPKKGCDDLIAAFARVARDDPALHLVMAGPDQVGWQHELTALAARLGIGNRITWTGMLKGNRKIGAFRAAEAFVLPSHQENFGIVVAEALACGTPVLISKRVNIWREVQTAKAGFVGDDGLEGTTALLREWLAADRGTRQRLRANAAACFRQNFELRTVITKLNDLLHRPSWT